MDDLLYDDDGLNGADVNRENFQVDEEEEIEQQDAWTVINEYFKEKKLVRQQIDSFNEFVQNTIQELVDDAGEIEITPQNQFIPGRDAETFTFVVKFEQIFVGSCIIFDVEVFVQ